MNISKLIIRHAFFFCRKSGVFVQRKYSHLNSQDNFKKVPFEVLINSRRSEASRSLIVQVKDVKSHQKLFDYVTQFGEIENSFFYSLNREKNFILFEFRNVSSYESALNHGQCLVDQGVIPVRSPLLWFRMNSKQNYPPVDAPEPISEPLDTSAVELEKYLEDANDLSEEMVVLYEKTKLNELGSRLRFLTGYQIEKAFSGLFPFCSVLPFGSSINGFGKLNCDLDLIFTFEHRDCVEDGRLIFHSKAGSEGSRENSRRYLETVADILQFFLPGCRQVKRILKARVPILKYRQDITGVDCDLSSTNLSGFFMSEFLYMLGTYDWRVFPLVFTVRYWAKEIGLTNPTPGKWISNFSLSLLVLFYLQYEKMIPNLEVLINHKRPEDTRNFEGVDCSFLRDLNLLPDGYTKPNDHSLMELLFNFFQFYSSFDFGSHAMFLNSGSIIPKPEYSPLYIVNPLERHLNVSKNVSPDECERLRMSCRAAAWNMECLMEDKQKITLKNLINKQSLRKNHEKMGSMKNSKFTVKTLFEKNMEPNNWKIPH